MLICHAVEGYRWLSGIHRQVEQGDEEQDHHIGDSHSEEEVVGGRHASTSAYELRKYDDVEKVEHDSYDGYGRLDDSHDEIHSAEIFRAGGSTVGRDIVLGIWGKQGGGNILVVGENGCRGRSRHIDDVVGNSGCSRNDVTSGQSVASVPGDSDREQLKPQIVSGASNGGHLQCNQ